VLYNIMLIAGVSTVMFNGNPLLRYDGYYILSDVTQIRIYAPRTAVPCISAGDRLFGLKLAPSEASGSERGWFVFYAIASFVYRTFVMLVIAISSPVHTWWSACCWPCGR